MQAFIFRDPLERIHVRLPDSEGQLPEETLVNGEWHEISEMTMERILFSAPDEVQRILQQIIA